MRTTIEMAREAGIRDCTCGGTLGCLERFAELVCANGCLGFVKHPRPAQRTWVGLTEQERNELEDYCEMIIGKAAFDAIEAKLKEKNNG